MCFAETSFLFVPVSAFFKRIVPQPVKHSLHFESLLNIFSFFCCHTPVNVSHCEFYLCIDTCQVVATKKLLSMNRQTDSSLNTLTICKNMFKVVIMGIMLFSL